MHSKGTARAKWEEGVGDGRSVWSETAGLHAAYSGRDKRTTASKFDIFATLDGVR